MVPLEIPPEVVAQLRVRVVVQPIFEPHVPGLGETPVSIQVHAAESLDAGVSAGGYTGIQGYPVLFG